MVEIEFTRIVSIAELGAAEALPVVETLVALRGPHLDAGPSLDELNRLIEEQAEGFGDIKIVHRSELRDAIRLKAFSCPEEGYAEIARRRSHVLPKPPARALSTIHKAKGLECDNAVLIAGDKDQFGGSCYARCKLYVAISRAKKSLTVVVSPNNCSPLLRTA